MQTKIIFENGSGLKAWRLGKDTPGLTPYRFGQLINEYKTKGILNLPAGYYVKSIQTLPGDKKDAELTTIIVIGQ
jgi:hypothetical protein